MRLIDADALPKFNGYALGATEVAMAVVTAPTIDAVPVVRCNQCKHYEGVHNVQGCAPCLFWNAMVLWNWFCFNGEREEGGT